MGPRRNHAEVLMKSIAAITTATLLVLGTSLAAQEHPEHPKQGEKQAEQGPEMELTVDELADAITAYIAQDSKLKGGYFLVWDAEGKQPLALKLDKVHKDRLSGLGGGVYF